MRKDKISKLHKKMPKVKSVLEVILSDIQKKKVFDTNMEELL